LTGTVENVIRERFIRRFSVIRQLLFVGIFLSTTVGTARQLTVQQPRPPQAAPVRGPVTELFCGDITFGGFVHACLASVKSTKRNYLLLKAERSAPFSMVLTPYSVDGVNIKYSGYGVSPDATGVLVEMTYELTLNPAKKEGSLMVTYLNSAGEKKGNEYKITNLEPVAPAQR